MGGYGKPEINWQFNILRAGARGGRGGTTLLVESVGASIKYGKNGHIVSVFCQRD